MTLLSQSYKANYTYVTPGNGNKAYVMCIYNKEASLSSGQQSPFFVNEQQLGIHARRTPVHIQYIHTRTVSISINSLLFCPYM